MAKKKMIMPDLDFDPQDFTPSEITKISVEGFKCFRDKTDVEIRPLTILAGANSSGKTSIMQLLLLMKQTILSPFDPPHSLLIDGGNVRFSKYEQLFWNKDLGKQFNLELCDNHDFLVREVFHYENEGLHIAVVEQFHSGITGVRITHNMLKEDVLSFISQEGLFGGEYPPFDVDWHVEEHRGFLSIVFDKGFFKDDNGKSVYGHHLFKGPTTPMYNFKETLMGMLHLSGERGTDELYYRKRGVIGKFPDVFEEYFASVILDWQTNDVKDELNQLNNDLIYLNLGSEIEAIEIDDNTIELILNSSIKKESNEDPKKFNISHVGVGVSESLPVLVALIKAQPGQIVYIEQPEIHLHPRAQFDLAKILAEAANRGVIVIAETHSDQLLLGVQHQVASGQIDTDKVKLHWFERDKDGASHVDSTDLDERGIAKKDWKADFVEVYMANQSKYLKASFKNGKKKLTAKTLA